MHSKMPSCGKRAAFVMLMFCLSLYIPGVQTQDGSKTKWFGTLFLLGQLQGQFGHLCDLNP